MKEEQRLKRNEYMRKWREANLEKARETGRKTYYKRREAHILKVKEYAKNNRELVLQNKREYYIKNKEVMLADNRRRRKENPEKYKEFDRKKYAKNLEKNREAHRIYADSHKEEAKERHVKWSKNNQEHIRKRSNERYHSDLSIKLMWNLRGRIYALVKGADKSLHTIELLGCSAGELEEHFKSLFTEGMTLEKLRNGEIHIDHVIPCSAFDSRNSEEQEICFHYTNLQPLWAFDNLSKGNRYIGDTQTQLYIDLAIKEE